MNEQPVESASSGPEFLWTFVAGMVVGGLVVAFLAAWWALDAYGLTPRDVWRQWRAERREMSDDYDALEWLRRQHEADQ